mgnify:CR=1 FL=1|jgi:uncharacterized protein
MAKSALVVDITPLKRQPGKQSRFELSVPPPDGVVLGTAEVRTTQLHLNLQLEGAGEEIIAQGLITVDWIGPCRRCLEDRDGSSNIRLREVFQTRPIEGETYLLAENEVDLEPMIREAVLLNLPIAPLCSEDCAGPDPSRFPTTVAVEPEPDVESPGDPRWAALSEITFDN